MAIFGLPFLTPLKPTKQPSPNSTPTPPKRVDYEEKGIELLASFIGDGVQFFETVATKSNENNKKIDQHFQDGLDWLTGINKSTSSNIEDSMPLSCDYSTCSSSSNMSKSLTEPGSSTLEPPSLDPLDLKDSSLREKAENFKVLIKDIITKYTENLSTLNPKKYLIKNSNLYKLIDDEKSNVFQNTVVKFLKNNNKSKIDQLSDDEFEQLLGYIIDNSNDYTAQLIKQTLIDMAKKVRNN